MAEDINFGSSFSTYEKQDKVLVALSGGVDSSVCVKILQDQGFEVTGLVIRFSPAHDAAVLAAQKSAEQLGISLQEADCEDLFNEAIIKPFCVEYCRGVTPSPCVKCNPLVKFTVLANAANALGIRYIASGHYAKIEEKDGKYYVAKSESAERDQSYMLYRLPQEILSRLLLPVGEFEKPDIREMAQQANLACADTKDSQEICFIPDGDYAAYIKSRGYISLKGNFIGPKGENLGSHKGVEHYTIGQRRGLDVAYGEPIFVKEINAQGDVILALGGQEYSRGITIKDMTFVQDLALQQLTYVKIRSRATPVPCIVTNVQADSLTVMFSEPIRAAAPGQSAVFYEDNLVLGGGIIDKIFE